MQRYISVILLVVLGVACRDAPGPDAADTTRTFTQTEQVTITLAVESGSLNRYQPLIELFEAEHPHIRVPLATVAELASPNDSGIQALASAADVFPYSPNRQGDTQYLLDLRPFLDLDPQFDPGDFWPGLLPPTSEPLLAVPTGVAYQVTYFDKAAFDDAGLPYPELDWTTDDFLSAALALTMREDGEVTRWGYVPGQLSYPPLLATQLAGSLGSGDELRLTDADVVAAVQWMADLFTVHEVSPWLEDYKPVERRSSSGGPISQTVINSGMAAMWHSTHLLFDGNNQDVGVAAVPRSQYGLAAEPIVYGFGVSRGTANPEAAWQLLHFLSRQPPQDAMFSVEPVPARRSVAAATNYWEQLPDRLAPVLQYTAENSASPRITYQAVNLLQEAIAAHVDEGVTVAAALDQSAAGAPSSPEAAEVEVAVVPDVEPDDEAEQIQITFANSGSFLEAHRLLANQFHQANRNIRVHIREETIELNVPQASLLDRVTGSDCFVGTSTDLLNDNLRAILLPAGPLLDLDITLQAEAFYPPLLNALTVDGELMGIPAGAYIPYIEYNRRLFQEAGIPEPSMDWTLADFLEIAQQLTKGEDEAKQYGFADPYGHMLFIRGIEEFGVQLLDDSSAIPNLNYEATAEVITWYADLVRLHEVQPFLTVNGAPDFAQFEALFREERIAMWPGGAPNYLHFMPVPFPNLDIGVAPEPLGPSGHRRSLLVDAYYIHADTPHPEACWEWIKFLITEPAATYARSQTYRLLPSHIETAESEEYVALVGAELAAVGHAYINTSAADSLPPLPTWMGNGFSWLIDTYYAVASGESDVATGLAEAEAKFSQYRQCIIEQDGFEDQIVQRECAQSVR